MASNIRPVSDPDDEIHAYIDEVARRARGEAPRPVARAEITPTLQKAQALVDTAASVTDERAGTAGKLSRLFRRTTFLAKDAHGRSHVDAAELLVEMERRIASLERRIDRLSAGPKAPE